jgi:hypothetical protein
MVRQMVTALPARKKLSTEVRKMIYGVFCSSRPERSSESNLQTSKQERERAMLQNDDAIKLARETLQKELTHYLDKLWKIFSWTSTILVSLIGGVVAIKFRGQPATLSIGNKVGLVVAIVVLSVYATAQLDLLLSFETRARDRLQECDEKLGIREARPTTSDVRNRPDTHPASKWFGYKMTVILLAIAAVFTVVFA